MTELVDDTVKTLCQGLGHIYYYYSRLQNSQFADINCPDILISGENYNSDTFFVFIIAP